MINKISKQIEKLDLYYFIIFIYSIFCLYFAFERMLNTDNSYQLFQIINTKNFFFQERRFGVFPTQIPLLIATYLKLPLKWIIYIYSLSFPLLYFIIIYINSKILKCKEAALATILSVLLGTAYTFYHSITETHQMLAIGSLLYGIVSSKSIFKKTIHYYLSFYSVLIWLLLTHPLAIFISLFIIGFAFLQKKITIKELLTIVLFCLAFFITKFLLTPNGSYDDRTYSHLNNVGEQFKNFSKLYSYNFLIRKSGSTFLAPFLVIGMVLLYYKKFIEVIYCSIAFVFFTTLSILVFSNGDVDAMMEKSFMPGFFVFTILFSSMYYKNELKYKLALSILCIMSFININCASIKYSRRLNDLRAVIQNIDEKHPKIIANTNELSPSLKYNYWSTSMDALLLSVSEDNYPKTLFLVTNKMDYKKHTLEPTEFLFLEWKEKLDYSLNKDYFNLTTAPYVFYKNN